MNYSRLVSSKCQVLVRTVVIFDLSFLFNQCSCLQYRHVNFHVSKPNISFSTANLTAKFASVTPPFTSHVLNSLRSFWKGKVQWTSSGCKLTSLCHRCHQIVRVTCRIENTQAATCDTGGTTTCMFVLCLEHCSDQYMKSTCADSHMTCWFLWQMWSAKAQESICVCAISSGSLCSLT